MVSEHGSTLGLDGRNVFFMHTCQFHMCYVCWWIMCLLCMHGGGHCCSYVAMWKLMVFVVGCDRHECMSVTLLLCMSVSICCYACIFMVIVVSHEVIVGIFDHHDFVDML